MSASFNGRQISYKIWLSNLLNGKFFNSPGDYEPNYVEIDNLKISRVNIIGAVVDKIFKEERRYNFITIDDSSSTIDVKCWGDDIHFLDGINIGDFVLVIGKIRRYNDVVHISPEIVRCLDNPNWLKLRKLELFGLYGEPMKIDVRQFSDALSEINNNSPEIIGGSDDSLELRGRILTIIEKFDKGDGVSIVSIENELKVNVEIIKDIIVGLLMNGEVFEVNPRMYRVMP